MAPDLEVLNHDVKRYINWLSITLQFKGFHITEGVSNLTALLIGFSTRLSRVIKSSSPRRLFIPYVNKPDVRTNNQQRIFRQPAPKRARGFGELLHTLSSPSTL